MNCDGAIIVDMSPANYIRHEGWRGVQGVVDAMRTLDLTKITSNTHAFAELGTSIKVTHQSMYPHVAY